ncbi:MAG TPA: DNA polymerase III subunit gamma/tau [Candidatus Methanoperedens sp.]|nr:DNA polymerase III subunit gamma/tau [Candidatus Methanoperedens sp.]
MSVFHLKYRPSKITELDLPEVSDKIKSIVLSNNDFQSLLFAGPKGSGKTSAARILAKSVNCLKLKDAEACGKCENCLEIEKGNSLDILEIDAASNRGIDDVRSLKENAYLSPIRLKKKIFIIDEVHMLTKEAFNALLKLIEEPPKDTLFILCTTDAQKIPETVLSRLLKVNFRKGKLEELNKSLEKIIKGEKIEINSDAVEMLVANSDGSFRNLQRTFNEIFLQFGDKIDIDNVKTYYATIRGEYQADELENDLHDDLKIVFDKLEIMAEKGVDFGELRLKWLQYFHQKLLIDLNNVELKRRIEILVKAGEMEKLSTIEQLPLELAVIEMMEKKESRNEKLETRNEKKNEEKKVVDNSWEEKKIEKEKEIEKKIVEAVKEVETKPKISVEIAEVQEKWGEILGAVKPYNHSVEAFLRAARPKKMTDEGLVIEVFYKFHKEKLEEAKNRKIVEIGLDKVFGGFLNFNCVLSDGENKKSTPLTVVKNDNQKVMSEAEIYDVAKDIFG